MNADETDVAAARAVDELADRLRERDAAEDRVDARIFALSWMTALRGQGWRPTPAKASKPWFWYRDAAVAWSAVHPVGTPVLAWPGTRDDEPFVTCTRTPAWTLGHGAAVVSVEGRAGGIALTHIQLIDPSGQEVAVRG